MQTHLTSTTVTDDAEVLAFGTEIVRCPICQTARRRRGVPSPLPDRPPRPAAVAAPWSRAHAKRALGGGQSLRAHGPRGARARRGAPRGAGGVRRTGALRRRTPLRRGGLLRRTQLRRGRAGRQRRGISEASVVQREKVAGARCLACGRVPCDPGHLVPRSLGGCDEADCVVPLCRPCHRDFDERRLDLLPYLEPRHRAELAHALLHVGLVGLLRRLAPEGDGLAERRRP